MASQSLANWSKREGTEQRLISGPANGLARDEITKSLAPLRVEVSRLHKRFSKARGLARIHAPRARRAIGTAPRLWTNHAQLTRGFYHQSDEGILS
jgi:hypothetical protein